MLHEDNMHTSIEGRAPGFTGCTKSHNITQVSMFCLIPNSIKDKACTQVHVYLLKLQWSVDARLAFSVQISWENMSTNH